MNNPRIATLRAPFRRLRLHWCIVHFITYELRITLPGFCTLIKGVIQPAPVSDLVSERETQVEWFEASSRESGEVYDYPVVVSISGIVEGKCGVC